MFGTHTKKYTKGYDWKKWARRAGITLSVLVLIGFGWWNARFDTRDPFPLGVTFSQTYAAYLNGDWRATYEAILKDLGVKRLRLIAYWNQIERAPGVYDFTDLDWQIDEARRAHAQIVLVMGRKVPRWPECDMPQFVRSESADIEERALDSYLAAVVERYRRSSSIIMWQVENEPLVAWFGTCPKPDKALLAREVALVHALDHIRPILLTDSGELGWWYAEGRLGDYFGTTMYQTVWNRYFGYGHYYIFRPIAYRLKAFLTGIHPSRVVISELQAEAWFPDGNRNISLEEQRKSMSEAQLRANVELARRTGFSGAYLWGAEYWYWLKAQGDPSMWNAAKELLK